ncbi:MAG: hypothetical protein JOY80_01120 [Candidatus Dormibacteraeota bacterium]|nr:hypothetical protein [Candidatus Dormibacteraeota bacterium]
MPRFRHAVFARAVTVLIAALVVAAPRLAAACGGQCEVICINGCNGGCHYNAGRALCMCTSDNNCNDAQSGCGGACQVVCGFTGDNGGCKSGYTFDGGQAVCVDPNDSNCNDFQTGCGGACQVVCGFTGRVWIAAGAA